MDWKIHRDYYYKDLYHLLRLDGIEEADYFEDPASIDYSIKDSKYLALNNRHFW
jgi:hypothetical protein